MALSSVEAQYTNTRMWIIESKRETFISPPPLFFGSLTHFILELPVLHHQAAGLIQLFRLPGAKDSTSVGKMPVTCWYPISQITVGRGKITHKQTRTKNFGVHFNVAAQLLWQMQSAPVLLDNVDGPETLNIPF